MSVVLWLLLLQMVLGAYDSLWHHEITQRLPARRSARRELLLHAARELLYATVFVGLAWREWRGLWAWVLGTILVAEVLLTLADFLEEDRTRRLPRAERVLHTVLAINYGVWLGVFIPHLYAWSRLSGGLIPADYGWLSRALTVAAAAVLLVALRNLYAGLRHFRPAYWLRHPYFLGSQPAPRTFLVTGGTGFIGRAVVRRLLARGDAVLVLTRTPDKALDRFGPHVRVVESLEQLEDDAHIDGIVNLAGAAILALPWLRARRRTLLESRVRTTREVVRLCGRLARAPQVLVSGSAIGYYGVRPEGDCDENAAPQAQFQSELCQSWEAAAAAAESLGTRVVRLRTGLVLGSDGGALPMMALPIRCFMGARLGRGRQWVSWIHLVDIVRLIELALDDSSLRGALNATAPEPVRHREFQHALARQLHRPLWLAIPGWVLRMTLGEMSQLLTAGQRVVPSAALGRGFRFKYPLLEPALRAVFAPPADASGAAVYFNGQCPVCAAEIAHYAGIAARTGAPVSFVDSMRDPAAFLGYGLRVEHLEERLYARSPEGLVTSGFEAVLQVWRLLPRYRVAARVLQMPGLRHGAVGAYDLLIAPMLARWARRRGPANDGILAARSAPGR